MGVPKLLKLKVFAEGEMKLEKVVPFGRSVIVGSALGCDLRISGAENVPDRFELFQFNESLERYFLRYNFKTMEGRVKGRVRDGKKPHISLLRLKQDFNSTHGGESEHIWSLELGPRHHGEVRLGEVTIAFKLVKKPSPQYAPPLIQKPFPRRFWSGRLFLITLGIAAALAVLYKFVRI